MGKLKLSRNQKGFTAVEGLLIILILVVIGAVGYMVYHNNHKAKTASVSTTAATKLATSASTNGNTTSYSTYTDPSKIYTLSYPSTWKEIESTGSFEPASIYYTPSDTPHAVFFVPPNSAANSPGLYTDNQTNGLNAVTVTAVSTSDTSGVLNNNNTGDDQTKIQDLTINGYTAAYNQDILTQNGAEAQYKDESSPNSGVQNPSVPATYTNDRYAVTHNGVTVFFVFTEQKGAAGGQQAFNATSSAPAFTSLVKSIKFLN